MFIKMMRYRDRKTSQEKDFIGIIRFIIGVMIHQIISNWCEMGIKSFSALSFLIHYFKV